MMMGTWHARYLLNMPTDGEAMKNIFPLNKECAMDGLEENPP